MTAPTNSGYSSGHVHCYVGDPPAPRADGWTYYTCSCGYQWRTKVISEPVIHQPWDTTGTEDRPSV